MRCPAVLSVLRFKVGRRCGVLWAYFLGASEKRPNISADKRDDLRHTYTSGIYMSVTLILACMAIVVTVVGVNGGVRVR